MSDGMNKTYSQLKATRHIVMGIIFLVFAAIMFMQKTFGAFDLSTGLAYTLGSILVLYGGFRIWRGFVDLKMLNKNSE